MSSSARVALSRAWVALRDAPGVVRLGQDAVTDAAASWGFRWILEDGVGSRPVAWVLGRLAREDVPDGIPILTGGPGACDMRLFLQPALRGPRMVVVCRVCGRERAYASAREFNDDRDDVCPIRSVMES